MGIDMDRQPLGLSNHALGVVKIFVVVKDVTIDCKTTTILCPVFFKTERAAEKYIKYKIEDHIKYCQKDAKCEVYNNGHTLRVVLFGSLEWYYYYSVMELYEGEDVYGHEEVD